MPTILRIKGYRFFFYSNDHSPAHIHVEKDDKTAKFKLDTLNLARSKGFNAKEISEIRTYVADNIDLFKSKWNEYFNN